MTTVVKVGGSLYDLPDLGTRLGRWVAQVEDRAIVLVPGGGAAADAVRDLDRTHALGEECAHWLALRALTLNAHFLGSLLPGARVVADAHELPTSTAPLILDAHAFARADEGRPGALPHSWDVTSDSIAARFAVVCGARRLILLKSVDFPATISWEEAGRRGLIDAHFARVLAQTRHLDVQTVNLRRIPSNPLDRARRDPPLDA